MEIDHRLLHRMRAAILAREMLDRHDMAAVERADEADAGVDAFIDELAVESRPTSTVQAPQSPSAQPSLVPRSERRQAQKIEQRRVRRDIPQARHPRR